METYKRTPLQLFNLPQHFIIPLFQRAYVWNREHQWELLWQDIRRTIEQRLQDHHPRERGEDTCRLAGVGTFRRSEYEFRAAFIVSWDHLHCDSYLSLSSLLE